jgi:hypothetical protein
VLSRETPRKSWTAELRAIWRLPQVRPVADDAKRHERFIRLRDDYRGIRDDSVTSLLLTEAKELLQNKQDGIKAIEAKASAEIGLVAGSIGLLSVVGPKTGELAFPTFWFFVGISFLFLSIAINLFAIWPTRYGFSSLDAYNDTDIVKFAAMKARIQLELTEGLLVNARRQEHTAGRKSRAFGVGTALLLLGILALFVNYGQIIARPSAKKVLYHASCAPRQGRIECSVEQ